MKIEEILRSLPKDKIKINWNKKPITVQQLCDFLPNINFEISRDHLGVNNGWTRRINKSLNLIIHGGIVDGVNLLDGIEYGFKKQNPYNNYVNPFALYDIMSKEGKDFFLDYYHDEIQALITQTEMSVINHRSKIKECMETLNELKLFLS